MQPNQNDEPYIPSGQKDIEIYNKSKEIILEFIDELNKKEFLKKHMTLEEDALTETVLDRINSESNSIAKLEKLFHDKQIELLLNDMSKHGISSEDVMNYYMALLAHQILDIFELFKKYFVLVLSKEKLELKGNPALGQIFHQLKTKNVTHRFFEILDMDLRNSIGHGWYWWKNNKFCYTVDPNLLRTKEMTLGEVYVKIRQTALLVRAFTDHAFDRILEITKESHVPNKNS